MATFDSIAEEYALKIKNSVKKSGITKSASLLQNFLSKKFLLML
jgi:hypothetical protein